MKRIHRLNLATALILLTALPLQAGMQLEITVPETLTHVDVKGAIWSAVTSRGWSITEHGDDYLTCELNHRGTHSVVSFTFDRSRISFSDESIGNVTRFKHAAGSVRARKTKGTVTPKRWMNNLRSDIAKHLVPNRTLVLSTPAAKTSSNLKDELKQLKSLHEEGLLSDAVYEKKQLELLTK